MYSYSSTNTNYTFFTFNKTEPSELTSIKAITKECAECLDLQGEIAYRFEYAITEFVTVSGVDAVQFVIPETLTGFTKKMKGLGFSSTTIYKKLQHVKRLYNYAAGKKYIHLNPFAVFKLPKPEDVEPLSLTLEEIEKIRRLHLGRGLTYIREIFLFQCNTGLSYCDLWAFNPKYITDINGAAYIKAKRVKPPCNEYIVPFTTEAKAIAEKHRYNFRSLSVQNYNKFIKQIAAKAQIEKNLSSKIGRKTFGQLRLDSGYSSDAVAKMMGHTDFRTTKKHYARVGIQRVINETLKMTG